MLYSEAADGQRALLQHKSAMDKIMGALEHIREEIEGLKESEKNEEGLEKVLATGCSQPHGNLLEGFEDSMKEVAGVRPAPMLSNQTAMFQGPKKCEKFRSQVRLQEFAESDCQLLVNIFAEVAEKAYINYSHLLRRSSNVSADSPILLNHRTRMLCEDVPEVCATFGQTDVRQAEFDLHEQNE
eukprot:Skav219274  [mRNA]  locus=scaffold1380:144855:151707:- [translate_table: standard]